MWNSLKLAQAGVAVGFVLMFIYLFLLFFFRSILLESSIYVGLAALSLLIIGLCGAAWLIIDARNSKARLRKIVDFGMVGGIALIIASYIIALVIPGGPQATCIVGPGCSSLSWSAIVDTYAIIVGWILLVVFGIIEIIIAFKEGREKKHSKRA